MSSFTLHPTLAADTWPVAALPLCRVLLMNDARYPWLILVPQRPALTELYQLSVPQWQQLGVELNAASAELAAQPTVRKVNVGSLGNLVPQLHVHVLGRQEQDPAWPGPVWGHSAAEPYPAVAARARAAQLRDGLGQRLGQALPDPTG